MRDQRSMMKAFTLLLLAACGGGGIGTQATESSSPPQEASTQAGATQAGNKATSGGAPAAASGGAGKAADGGGAGSGVTTASGGAGASAPGDVSVAGGGGSAAGGGAVAGAGGAGAAPTSDGADASPGCTDGKLMPGDSMLTLQSGGASRVYVQHVPPGYDGKTPLPVILDLHGGSYDGPRWVDASGLKKLGDTENFITLFPSGTDNSWLATEAESADGDFLRELVAEVGKQGCIDRKRIYSTGCSMGGAMSFWMGCFASDLIAAIAPMCGTPFFELADCKPQRPFSMMLVMGETDNLNCWDGMPSGIGNPCVMQVFEHFKGLNMCTGEAKDLLGGVCHTYDTCGQGDSATEVTVCKSDTGHGVYQATNIEVANEAWKFLKRFHLP